VLSNYGEAGAVDLYGPAYGLPSAISTVDSYWLRGYGDPPPAVVIVVGEPPAVVAALFDRCTVAGHIANQYGIQNDETRTYPDIFVCRQLRQPWPAFWRTNRTFN